MRTLASIQIIDDIQPIEGADRIEVASVLGWQCVVKKGEFQPGNPCVYFEIDSVLPPREWADFMRDRKYRVKTIKLRKQISQGLALPLDSFPEFSLLSPRVGDDVTDILGVTKYVHPSELDPVQQVVKKYPWYTRLPLGMRLYRYLHPRRGNWPEWLPKTDETRVQNLSNIDKHIGDRQLYATEKLEGQSLTYFFNRSVRDGLFAKGIGGVCSRNINFYHWETQENNWCTYAREHNLVEGLENYCRENKVSLAIQGELIGPGIQDNIYELCSRDFYVFNIWNIDEQRYLNLSEKLDVLSVLLQKHVPFIKFESSEEPLSFPHYTIRLPKEHPYTREEFLQVADGMSIIPESECLREGLVFRDIEDDGFSFKAVSNKYLLKYNK